MARCSRRRCARHLVLAWLLGSLVGLAQTTHAAERQLFMLVVGQSGQPVLDVSTADLSLEQVGAECTVNGLYPENVPMKVALLVDNSDAAGRSINSLREGLRRFLDTLPAQHEVGLFTIASQVRRRVDFTTDRDELKERAEALFAERDTTTLLVDSLVDTWERRFDDEDTWPVFVVVVYDGPEASRSVQEQEFNTFVRDLYARAATVHTILISIPGGGSQTRVSVFLTEQTGGIYRALAAPTALPDALTELATVMQTQYEEVKDRYRVVYECNPDDPAAAVSVGVTRQDVTVALFPNRRISR